MQAARALDAFELAFDPRDALRNDTAVRLELGLARPAEKAKAAALTLEMGPRPHQAAALIGQMGEFDLQRAFARRRAPAEDLEN